jgi:hypothetical protein
MGAAARATAWVLGVVLAAALVAWLYARASAAPRPLQADEFSRIVRRLASDAREGARLAAALERDQLSANYGRYQHRRIGEDLSDTREKLDAPFPGGGDDLSAAARGLADRIATDLQATMLRMSDHAALERIAEDETRLAEALERMDIVPQ